MANMINSRWLNLHSLGMQWEERGNKTLFSMVCMNHIQVRSQSRSVLPLNYGEEDEVIKMFFFSCNWYVKKDFFYHSKWASQVALVVKKLTINVGGIRDLDSIPVSGKFPGKGHGNPLQYCCPENPMDRGPWRATVHRVAQSKTQLKQLSTWFQVANGSDIFNILEMVELLASKLMYHNHKYPK